MGKADQEEGGMMGSTLRRLFGNAAPTETTSQPPYIRPTMIETFYSDDLFVEKRKGRSKANHAVVFCHSFPGGGTRGMDLGAAVHEHAGLTTFVVNYGGLGQGRGTFGFLKSVEESVAFAEQLRP